MSSGAEKYGKYFWCIVLTKGETIMLNADLSEITPTGVLVLSRINSDGNKHINYALPAREWKYFWAASVFDGHPVAVDSWSEKEESKEESKEKVKTK